MNSLPLFQPLHQPLGISLQEREGLVPQLPGRLVLAVAGIDVLGLVLI